MTRRGRANWQPRTRGARSAGSSPVTGSASLATAAQRAGRRSIAPRASAPRQRRSASAPTGRQGARRRGPTARAGRRCERQGIAARASSSTRPRPGWRAGSPSRPTTASAGATTPCWRAPASLTRQALAPSCRGLSQSATGCAPGARVFRRTFRSRSRAPAMTPPASVSALRRRWVARRRPRRCWPSAHGWRAPAARGAAGRTSRAGAPAGRLRSERLLCWASGQRPVRSGDVGPSRPSVLSYRLTVDLGEPGVARGPAPGLGSDRRAPRLPKRARPTSGRRAGEPGARPPRAKPPAQVSGGPCQRVWPAAPMMAAVLSDASQHPAGESDDPHKEDDHYHCRPAAYVS